MAVQPCKAAVAVGGGNGSSCCCSWRETVACYCWLLSWGKEEKTTSCGGRGSRLAGCWWRGAARSLVAQGRREKEGEEGEGGEGGITALVSI